MSWEGGKLCVNWMSPRWGGHSKLGLFWIHFTDWSNNIKDNYFFCYQEFWVCISQVKCLFPKASWSSWRESSLAPSQAPSSPVGLYQPSFSLEMAPFSYTWSTMWLFHLFLFLCPSVFSNSSSSFCPQAVDKFQHLPNHCGRILSHL